MQRPEGSRVSSVLEKQHGGGMAGGMSKGRVVGDEVEEVM